MSEQPEAHSKPSHSVMDDSQILEQYYTDRRTFLRWAYRTSLGTAALGLTTFAVATAPISNVPESASTTSSDEETLGRMTWRNRIVAGGLGLLSAGLLGVFCYENQDPS